MTETIELKFHPLHLTDLRKSGLTDETIYNAAIESVRPEDINRELGYCLPGITSAYRIPYPGTDGFSRFRVFCEERGGPKYLQRKGSGNWLYIPEITRGVLDDVSVPIYFTEGEKKTLKACQEGLPCVGLSGLWNWKNKNSKRLIDDFNLIALSDRTVYIIPDNDWLEPDRHGYPKNLEKAVKELAYRLINKGAHVFIVKLPRGADDESRA